MSLQQMLGELDAAEQFTRDIGVALSAASSANVRRGGEELVADQLEFHSEIADLIAINMIQRRRIERMIARAGKEES